MMRTTIDECQIRSSDEAEYYLADAFEIYCKTTHPVTKRNMTEHETEVLEWCQENSHQPIMPAFAKLRKPFPGYSFYEMYIVDILHTYIGKIYIIVIYIKTNIIY